MKRIVIWENANFIKEIATLDGKYILEYPSMMPMHSVMEALSYRGYPSNITDWKHVNN